MPHRFKDIEHLLRLAAVFAIGLLLFAVARAELVPDDFGKYGHYRAGAVDAVRARPIMHAGQAACAECHSDTVDTRATGLHTVVACESCHGPHAKHAADPDVKAHKPDDKQTCVRCHAANTGKPKWFRTVSIAEHAGTDSCISCHKPHTPCESLDGDAICESGASKAPVTERRLP
jgi:hypothetical protein